VAYDERLVDRIRELVEAEPLLTEQRMFGGLALLIGGNMAVATSGQGGALIRVDPAKSARLIATTAVEPMLIGARSMDGSISTPSRCAPSGSWRIGSRSACPSPGRCRPSTRRSGRRQR
jgi:hypothetical protein